MDLADLGLAAWLAPMLPDEYEVADTVTISGWFDRHDPSRGSGRIELDALWIEPDGPTYEHQLRLLRWDDDLTY